MAEVLTLTSPPPQPPQLTSWRVAQLHLNWTGANITVVLIGNNNSETLTHTYTGTTATTFMNALNKANLSTTSLHKRVIERLVTDGVIAGTISGSPD